MLSVKNLTKSILGNPLFEQASFVLHKGDKVGLIGPNGCGKSTLLKIIVGEMETDEGNIQLDHERVGYLHQNTSFGMGDTIEIFLSSSRADKKDKVLKEVGLTSIPAATKIEHLSGGQKTRLALAKVLLHDPTFLLLDEPTNHLDIQGLEWLEQFIQGFKGGVLIVSHDRRLLDTSVNKILEIDPDNHTFHKYIGGYSKYLAHRKKRIEAWEESYWQQQREKKRLENWLVLKKQEAHIHADPAKGKQIRAMEKRIQRDIYDQEIKKPKDANKLRLRLHGNTEEAKLIIRADDICKSFSGKQIFSHASFEVRGKEHILLSGENGSGKTTLIKILVGEVQPDGGSIRIGSRVEIGYFAQEHEILNLHKTVMEEFLSTDRLVHASKDPRFILGSFLFSGQSVFRKVSDLSMGERVRLIFAKLTNQENQLLVLDEPTNHLDIPSREAIEQALQNYQGAIIVVSHDRYFLDKIGVDRVLILEHGSTRSGFYGNTGN